MESEVEIGGEGSLYLDLMWHFNFYPVLSWFVDSSVRELVLLLLLFHRSKYSSYSSFYGWHWKYRQGKLTESTENTNTYGQIVPSITEVVELLPEKSETKLRFLMP